METIWRGLKNLEYSFGLLGGYRFNSTYNFVTGFYFEQTGSNRKGEKAPLLSGNYLAEIDLKQVSVLFALARSFGEDWDGTYRYRALAGIKYNRIMSTDSNLSSSNVNENFEMTDSDFRSAYFVLNLSGGIRLHNRFWLMGTYEHALNSILAKDSKAPFDSRLIPFTFTASLVYYIL